MWPFSSKSQNASQHPQSINEASLVRRLDMFLLTFGCISQVIKFLDQTNIQNAYVSGMKEDLDLYGNELNYFTTYFNIGYCIMLIPSQIILTYVRPSYWLPGLEIVWGILTGLLATVNNAKQVYAIRVFVGLCESSAWPGMMTILMHWYTPMELAKRMAFYHSCQSIGSMMSGAMQAAISSTLHDSHGIAGWRWLFIINSIMTVVVGLLGFVMLPDYPNRPNPRALWFTRGHAELALERLVRHGRTRPSPISWAGARRTFKSWITLIVPILYGCTVLGSYGVTYFSLFLSTLTNADGSKTWSVAKVNAIPIGGRAIQVVFVWVWAILSDFFQIRWQLIIAQTMLALIPTIMLSVWTSMPDQTPLGVAYAGFFLNFMVLGTAPLIFSWLADIIPQDPEARALVVGVSITLDYAIQAWSNELMWSAKEAPYYSVGWKVSAGLMAAASIMVLVLRVADSLIFRKQREAFDVIQAEAEAEAEDNEGEEILKAKQTLKAQAVGSSSRPQSPR